MPAPTARGPSPKACAALFRVCGRCTSPAEKGRGRALRRVWSESDAEVVAYMDVDLSTDLDALLPLVSALASGHSDVAIGRPGSRAVPCAGAWTEA